MPESILSPNENPVAALEAHFAAQPPVAAGAANPALRVEAIGFVRYRGDWLGVLLTPWRLDLLLIDGGGELWGDIPAGQRRYLDLYGATLPFIAVEDAQLGSYQYSPLVDEIGRIPDLATAREIARDALHSYLPPPVDKPTPPAEPVSRRGFFRRLAGKH